MPLTRKQWIILGGVGIALAAAVIVGVTVGVVVGRQKSTSESTEQRVNDLLKAHPLIDG